MFRASKESGIKENIILTFFYLIMGVMLLISLTAWYLNEETIESVKESDLKNEHTILTNILIPSLFVNNTTEIRKTLNLASSNNKTFAVIDKNKNIFLPDYEKLSLVQSINNKNYLKKCQQNHFLYKEISGKNYFIYCSSIKNQTLNYVNKKFGLLISFTNETSFYFSKLFIYFVGLGIGVLLLTFFWFNKTLNQKLLKPLISLEKSIRQSEKELLLTNKLEIKNDEITPIKEVLAIKNAFERVIKDLCEENRKRLESDKKIMIINLAESVAHDIRSPVMALSTLLNELSSEISSKKFQTLEQSIQSIRDIANNLLAHYQTENQETEKLLSKTITDDGNQKRYILLPSIIEVVTSQKRYEWKELPCELQVDIEPKARSIWIYASPNEIKRSISNLLNNSYEALDKDSRKIVIHLSVMDEKLKCSIKDNGIGIASKYIEMIINGKSLKKDGHGLGLSGAKKIIESLSGELILTSVEKEGTEVILLFPFSKKPSWFPSTIILPSKNTIAVLDDDLSVHNLWRNRTDALKMIHFTEVESFFKWLDINPELKATSTYLFDYTLNQDSSTGLELLEGLSPDCRGYLLTSHAEEVEIQRRCELAGIWLIPKSLFEYMPIETHI